MRLKRKVIASLLIIAIMSSFIPNLVSYAVDPTFTMSVDGAATKTATVGDTVSVDFNLAGGLENQKVLGVVIGYDSTALEVVADTDDGTNKRLSTSGSINPEIVPDATLAIGYVESTNVTLALASASAIPTSGRIATIKFKVLKEGESSISYTGIKYAESEGAGAVETQLTSLSSVMITGTTASQDSGSNENTGGNTGTDTDTIPMTGLTITPSAATQINKGYSKTFQAAKVPANTTNTDEIVWISSDDSIATVNGGVVYAGKPGFVLISAVCGDFVASVEVTVRAPVTGVNIIQEDFLMHKGDTQQLTAEKEPSDTTDTKPITWRTTNNNVVSVDQNGIVTAVGAGTAVVSATCALYSDSITITVDAPLKGISIEQDDVEMDINGSEKLKLVLDPMDTTDPVVPEWSSSDSKIVSVDNSGNIRGLAHGSAKVTVKVGSYSASINVIVNAHITDVIIKNEKIKEDRTLELYKGQSTILGVDFKPEVFAETRTIEWESSDSSVARMENGKVIAVKPGTARITATAVNGVSDTITVNVPAVHATVIVLNTTEITLEKGSSRQLTATIEPENTTDDTTITWRSNDENIVKVDQKGKVTAVGTGFTSVTASAAGLTATCIVEVSCALQSISLNYQSLKLELDKPVNEVLKVTKVPEDATVDEVADTEWTSLNESVCKVEGGVLKPIAPGTAIIQAKLGDKVATCSVRVVVKLTGVEIQNQSETLELSDGQMFKMNVVFTPANATDYSMPTWSSSNEKVATVDSKGLVMAKELGTAIITVDYGDGITASRTVEVVPARAETVTIDQVIERMVIGQEEKLSAVIKPNNAIDEITWSTSDEKIATIDNKGRLKAIAPGDVTITATATNGKSASLEIEVYEVELETIEVTTEKESIMEGEKTQILVTYNPEDTTDTITVKYETEDETIATVNEKGVITAKKAGDAVLTVIVTAVNCAGEETELTSQVELEITEKPIEEPTDKPTTQNPSNSNTTSTNTVAGTTTGTNTSKNTNTTNKTTSTTQSTVSGLVTSPHTGDMNVPGLVMITLLSLLGMYTRFKSIELTINK